MCTFVKAPLTLEKRIVFVNCIIFVFLSGSSITPNGSAFSRIPRYLNIPVGSFNYSICFQRFIFFASYFIASYFSPIFSSEIIEFYFRSPLFVFFLPPQSTYFERKLKIHTRLWTDLHTFAGSTRWFTCYYMLERLLAAINRLT